MSVFVVVERIDSGAAGGRVSGASINTDVFLTAQQAIKEVSGDLHGVLAKVEALQFDTAALVAAIAHGPLRPPGSAPSGGEWVGLPAKGVFGPGMAPPVHPEALPSSPASASSLSEYELRVQGLPRSLVLGREIQLSVKALDVKQDT
ncbi:unnamed protein product, partial [Polarella glacialis]